MKVYVKNPQEKIKEMDITNELEPLQALVGGYIEIVPISDKIVMIVNEEGKLMGLPYNFIIRGDTIVGPAVFAGVNGEEFTDAPDIDVIIDAFLGWLEWPAEGEEEEEE